MQTNKNNILITKHAKILYNILKTKRKSYRDGKSKRISPTLYPHFHTQISVPTTHHTTTTNPSAPTEKPATPVHYQQNTDRSTCKDGSHENWRRRFSDRPKRGQGSKERGEGVKKSLGLELPEAQVDVGGTGSYDPHCKPLSVC